MSIEINNKAEQKLNLKGDNGQFKNNCIKQKLDRFKSC